MEYTPVTQIVVSVSPAECNVPTITQLVTKQVGFQAVLLDSQVFSVAVE